MIPDHSIRICADRGGTFCDIHASYPDPSGPGKRKDVLLKLLSQDPSNYADAPTEGIRRVLEQITNEPIPRNATRLSSRKIDSIRLSTTVATNALLERKGQPHALLITRGFRDLLLIGNQSRPRIFDLDIRRPEPLYDCVVEIDERVTLLGYTSDPTGESLDPANHPPVSDEGDIVRGLSGELVHILRRPSPSIVLSQLQSLRSAGYTSLAIVFIHSYTFPSHEHLVASLAQSLGFTHISCSSALLPMIKVLPRGTSATADAYLTPVLRGYLDGFFAGFDEEMRVEGRVEFMGSDGGLVDARGFNGLKSILSGPAGGVVGYALTSWDEKRRKPIIGIDIGGTSTDVSRYAGSFPITYSTTTAGISIQTPQLDINTVAAGGGSRLSFLSGLLRAGPESAGADPGPRCYRKGGPLAVTDANLMLGRLIPEYFPKIFGPGENEGLDVDASREGFEEVWEEVRGYYGESRDERTLDEVVYGFVTVANETMCRPIRALTEAKGHSTSEHILASFGGAGGQHACDIARILGIQHILIHRYSSILSAYGLSLADRAYEKQEPCSTPLQHSLISRLDALEKIVRGELADQGFEGDKVRVDRLLNMRFDGTDTALMISGPSPSSDEEEQIREFENRFVDTYKQEFGFLLEEKRIVVDDIKVRGTGKTYDTLGPSVYDEIDSLPRTPLTSPSSSSSLPTLTPTGQTKLSSHHSVYFNGIGRVPNTPVFKLGNLETGDVIDGPAVVLDETQTIVIVPGARALVTSGHLSIELGPPKGGKE